MSYPAKVIANAFLDKAEQEGTCITPMKLQKLIYYAHGWYLAIKEAPLLDEFLEAWDYGPVVSSVYGEFRNIGASGIRTRATQWDPETSAYVIPKPKVSDTDLSSLINSIWDSYGQYSAIQLSEMTHYLGAPWHTVKSQYPNMRNVQIPNEVVKSYFQSLLGESQSTSAVNFA